MATLAQRRPTRAEELRPARLALLAGALLSLPVLFASEVGIHERDVVILVAASSASLSALVLARLAGVVRRLERLRRRERVSRVEAQRARRQLRAQNDRLLELDRLKDDLVASVSHELRSPLTAMLGHLCVVARDEETSLSEDSRRSLEVVDRGARRVLRLVDDLPIAAELQAGTYEIEREPVDLAELARERAELSRPQAEAAGLELSLDADRAVLVTGDRNRLGQVLDNLVSNALKFTPRGGRVTITADGDVAVLEVADTGIGIAEHEQERLFDRFARAASAVDDGIAGTGLGLHIARELAAAHGGSIAVASEQGLGTTFRVTLPTRDAARPRVQPMVAV